ncbi:MAG: hypothetical protein LBU12_01880 [Deltaproteobacteria bacterium]|jgi:hypothetical protein|nr:hypothetical protein [Deltaproteobacteria bacterium]
MLTFVQIRRRLRGLLLDLDGELWSALLAELDPPAKFPKPETVHDLCFRDAKALAGYVPDLRAVMRGVSPKALAGEELEAFQALKALFNFSARLPTLLLSLPDYRETAGLIDLYNGYRQVLKELDDYLQLTSAGAAS